MGEGVKIPIEIIDKFSDVINRMIAAMNTFSSSVENNFKKINTSGEQTKQKLTDIVSSLQSKASQLNAKLAADVVAVEQAGGKAAGAYAVHRKEIEAVLSKQEQLGIVSKDALLKLRQDADKHLPRVNSHLTDMQKAMTAVIAVFSARAIFQAITELGSRAAQLAPVTAGFENLSRSIGTTADVMLSKLHTATRGLLNDMDLMQKLNLAVTLGVAKNADEFSSLASAAQRLGRALGLDVNHAYESLIIGIGRQSRLVLDNLGIIVKAADAHRQYAEAIGKTVKQLTAEEQHEAYVQAAYKGIREAVAKLGPDVEYAGDHFLKLTANWENFLNSIAQSEQFNWFMNALEKLGAVLLPIATEAMKNFVLIAGTLLMLGLVAFWDSMAAGVAGFVAKITPLLPALQILAAGVAAIAAIDFAAWAVDQEAAGKLARASYTDASNAALTLKNNLIALKNAGKDIDPASIVDAMRKVRNALDDTKDNIKKMQTELANTPQYITLGKGKIIETPKYKELSDAIYTAKSAVSKLIDAERELYDVQQDVKKSVVESAGVLSSSYSEAIAKSSTLLENAWKSFATTWANYDYYTTIIGANVIGKFAEQIVKTGDEIISLGGVLDGNALKVYNMAKAFLSSENYIARYNEAVEAAKKKNSDLYLELAKIHAEFTVNGTAAIDKYLNKILELGSAIIASGKDIPESFKTIFDIAVDTWNTDALNTILKKSADGAAVQIKKLGDIADARMDEMRRKAEESYKRQKELQKEINKLISQYGTQAEKISVYLKSQMIPDLNHILAMINAGQLPVSVFWGRFAEGMQEIIKIAPQLEEALKAAVMFIPGGTAAWQQFFDLIDKKAKETKSIYDKFFDDVVESTSRALENMADGWTAFWQGIQVAAGKFVTNYFGDSWWSKSLGSATSGIMGWIGKLFGSDKFHYKAIENWGNSLGVAFGKAFSDAAVQQIKELMEEGFSKYSARVITEMRLIPDVIEQLGGRINQSQLAVMLWNISHAVEEMRDKGYSAFRAWSETLPSLIALVEQADKGWVKWTTHMAELVSGTIRAGAATKELLDMAVKLASTDQLIAWFTELAASVKEGNNNVKNLGEQLGILLTETISRGFIPLGQLKDILDAAVAAGWDLSDVFESAFATLLEQEGSTEEMFRTLIVLAQQYGIALTDSINNAIDAFVALGPQSIKSLGQLVSAARAAGINVDEALSRAYFNAYKELQNLKQQMIDYGGQVLDWFIEKYDMMEEREKYHADFVNGYIDQEKLRRIAALEAVKNRTASEEAELQKLYSETSSQKESGEKRYAELLELANGIQLDGVHDARDIRDAIKGLSEEEAQVVLELAKQKYEREQHKAQRKQEREEFKELKEKYDEQLGWVTAIYNMWGGVITQIGSATSSIGILNGTMSNTSLGNIKINADMNIDLNPVVNAVNGLQPFLNDIEKAIKKIPSKQSGGAVEFEGLHYLHKGEYVIPPSGIVPAATMTQQTPSVINITIHSDWSKSVEQITYKVNETNRRGIPRKRALL